MLESPASTARPNWALKLALASGSLLLLAMMFQWDIVDLLTPFLWLPLLALAWFLVALAAILSIWYAVRHRNDGRSALQPLAASCGTLLLAFLVPFTQIWVHANFYLKKSAREQVVAKVKSGEYTVNVPHNTDLISLPDGHDVSKGGNEIIVQGPRDNPYVFFFTFRGILDNYSGFLWVPTGKEPQDFRDAGEREKEIAYFGGNWYFIGHR